MKNGSLCLFVCLYGRYRHMHDSKENMNATRGIYIQVHQRSRKKAIGRLGTSFQDDIYSYSWSEVQNTCAISNFHLNSANLLNARFNKMVLKLDFVQVLIKANSGQARRKQTPTLISSWLFEREGTVCCEDGRINRRWISNVHNQRLR